MTSFPQTSRRIFNVIMNVAVTYTRKTLPRRRAKMRARNFLIIGVILVSLVLLTLSLCVLTSNPKRRPFRLPPIQNDVFEGDNPDIPFGPPQSQLPLIIAQSVQPIIRRASLVQSETEDESREDNITKSYIQTNQSFPSALLTLFTTMKDTGNRIKIHNNTLNNWAALQPFVIPVLFIEQNTSFYWAERAKSLGWQIINGTRTNKGIPILKHMFLRTQRDFNTPLYGFANADILFDKTLIENMKAMTDFQNYTGNLFLIGKRANLNVSKEAVQNMSTSDLANVANISAKFAELFETNAQDYFITTRGGFPWRQIPDFVVGRPGYDNWLVVMAQKWNMTVVDATYTLNAVHQTGTDGNRSGWGQQDNRCINREIIGRFNYTRGHTKCVHYISYKDITGNIKIFRRPRIAADCFESSRRVRYSPLNGCV